MTINDPGPAVGDTKDWVWAATRPCAECGFDPTAIDDVAVANTLRGTTSRWAAVLAGPDARDRPKPAVWSPLEYACHVRDVHRVFTGRVTLMLTEDAPQFANWDQYKAAVAGRYWAADPAVVAAELAEAAEQSAAGYDAVPADAWSRTGMRSNGSAFTISSIGHYHLHDVVHHLYDVQG